METERKVRLLLSGKNPTLRAGIKKLLGEQCAVEIVGEVRTAREALREAPRLNPGFIFMDISAENAAALDVIREIRKMDRRIETWVCSLWDERELLKSCLRAGAAGCIPSTADSAELRRILNRPEERSRRHSQRVYEPGHSKVALWAVLALAAWAAAAFAQQIPVPAPEPEQPEGVSAVSAGSQMVPADSQNAEEAPTPTPRKFYFTSPFSSSFVREDRLPLGNQVVSDSAELISLPEMTIADTTPQTSFALSYHPQYEHFDTYQNLSSWTHEASLRLRHQSSGQWSTSLVDDFLDSYDASEALGESMFLLPRGRFVENILHLEEDYQYNSRTRFTAGFYGMASALDLPEVTRFVPYLPANVFDSAAAGLEVAAMRDVAANQRLTGTYEYLLFRNLTPQSASLVPVDRGILRLGEASLTYAYGRESGGPFAELSGGLLSTDVSSFIGSAEAGYRWRNFTLIAGYDRQAALLSSFGVGPPVSNPLLSGLFPESVVQAITLDWRGTFGRRLVIDLHGSGGTDFVALGPHHDNFGGRARIGYLISGRVLPFAEAEYFGDEFNLFEQERISRSRFSAGLSILLTPVRDVQAIASGDFISDWPIGTPGLVPGTTPEPGAMPEGVGITHVVPDNP